MPVIFACAVLSNSVDAISLYVKKFMWRIFAKETYVLTVKASMHDFSSILNYLWKSASSIGNWINFAVSHYMMVSCQNDFALYKRTYHVELVSLKIVLEKSIIWRVGKNHIFSFFHRKNVCDWIFIFTFLYQLARFSICNDTNLVNIITNLCYS